MSRLVFGICCLLVLMLACGSWGWAAPFELTPPTRPSYGTITGSTNNPQPGDRVLSKACQLRLRTAEANYDIYQNLYDEYNQKLKMIATIKAAKDFISNIKDLLGLNSMSVDELLRMGSKKCLDFSKALLDLNDDDLTDNQRIAVDMIKYAIDGLFKSFELAIKASATAGKTIATATISTAAGAAAIAVAGASATLLVLESTYETALLNARINRSVAMCEINAAKLDSDCGMSRNCGTYDVYF